VPDDDDDVPTSPRLDSATLRAEVDRRGRAEVFDAIGRAVYLAELRERSGDGFSRPPWHDLPYAEKIVRIRQGIAAILAFVHYSRDFFGVDFV
jgi:hypothetical protein